MKKITKLLVAIVMLMLAMLCLSNNVEAAVYTKTAEEFQKKYEEFIEYKENNPDDDESYRFEPMLINGKNTYDFIEIEYEDESQKELFDYTFEDGVITVKIKDSDLYDALKSKNFTVNESDELFKKLEKYVNEDTKYIGLKVKLYFTGDISEISATHIQDNGVRFLEQDETTESDKYFVGKDEKGTYMELLYGGTLADKWTTNEFQIGSRNLGISTNSWNNAEFLIRGFKENEKTALTGEAYDTARLDGNFSKTCSEYAIISFKAELAETTEEDKETGVSITAKKDSAAKLVVKEMDKNNADYKEMAAKLKDSEIVGAYDVKIDGDYEGNIQVSFTLGEEYNGKVATILHKKADGKIESFEKTIVNGKVTILVKELSPFMIAVDKETIIENNNNSDKENTNNGVNKEETTNTQNNNTDKTENNTKVENTTDRELDNTPKTGTINLVPVAFIIVLASILGIVLITKKH